MKFIITGAVCTAIYFAYIKLGILHWREESDRKITVGSILFCMTMFAIPYFNIGYVIALGAIGVLNGRSEKIGLGEKIHNLLSKELF